MSVRDVMNYLDKHKGQMFTVDILAEKLKNKISKRSLFNCLKRATKREGYYATMIEIKLNHDSRSKEESFQKRYVTYYGAK